MPKGVITEIKLSEDGVCPIMVQFQNSKFQESEARRMRSAIFRSHKDRKVAVVANEEGTYVGKVKQEDGFYRRFLIVRNRRTGNVRLTALTCATMEHQVLTEKVDLVNAAVPNSEALSNLNKQFGSKRIKRMTEQKERMTMNIENVKEQLEHTVADVKVDESDLYLSQVNENASSCRPPINRNAATPKEVYDIDEMLPGRLLDSLEEEALHVLDSDLDEIELLHPFIKLHLTTIQNSSASDRVDKCKLLLYVNYLMNFIGTSARAIGVKKFVICKSSPAVNHHILTNFSVCAGTGRTRPLSMRDKAICYILVLLMVALNYKVDVELLSKDLKLGVKKIKDMGRVLAFTPNPKDTKVMVLALPLPSALSNVSLKRKRKV